MKAMGSGLPIPITEVTGSDLTFHRPPPHSGMIPGKSCHSLVAQLASERLFSGRGVKYEV